VVTFGCEYGSCAPIGEGTEKPGMEPPLTYWERPGIAPSNLMLYDGARFGAWRGNVLVGALAGRAVWRLELVASRGEVKVVRRERLYAELGERIRDVKQGPDGSIYLLTDGGNARIVRIGGPDPWRHL
jgi:glucose/arabinose dehydrogenase